MRTGLADTAGTPQGSAVPRLSPLLLLRQRTPHLVDNFTVTIFMFMHFGFAALVWFPEIGSHSLA